MIINLLSVPEFDNSYTHVVDFDNLGQQLAYFNSKVTKQIDSNFRGDTVLDVITLDCPLRDLYNVDYCYFVDDRGKTIFYFITNKEIRTESSCDIILEVDVWNTYMFDYSLLESYVERCHVPRWNNGIPSREIADEGISLGEPKYSSFEAITTLQNNYIMTASLPLGKIATTIEADAQDLKIEEINKAIEKGTDVQSLELIKPVVLMDTKQTGDRWGHANIRSGNTIIPNALYFYLVNETVMQTPTGITVKAIPPTSAVNSVVYTPYIRKEDLNLVVADFDSDRFPLDENQKDQHWADGSKVQRILSMMQDTQIRRIGQFSPYKLWGVNLGIGQPRKWNNEGKLWQYPYNYAMLYDAISEPMEIKPHNCFDPRVAEIYVKQPLTDSGKYALYVQKYKEDSGGYFESSVSGSSFQIPILASSYTDYMASNRNQLQQQKKEATQKLVVAGAKAVVAAGVAVVAGPVVAPAVVAGGAAAAATMGAKAAKSFSSTVAKNQAAVSSARAGAKSAGGGLASSAMDYSNTIKQQQAVQKDVGNVPGSLSGLGSDALFDIQCLDKRNQLNLYRITQHEEILQQIGDYFAMYGYLQNKIMRLNTRNRYYYNFIRTMGVNLAARGVQKDHLAVLKNIYDKGVTIWHISRSGVTINDYSYDNAEV